MSRRAVVRPSRATPAGSDAAREAILKALTVETLIGDAVSLSNQQYPEVDSAIKRFINGDLAGAREYLEVAKNKYPKLPPTDLTLAKMQVIVRNGQAARAFLEKVVMEHPGDPEAYLLLADLAFVEGRITEAHALFEKADAAHAKVHRERQAEEQLRDSRARRPRRRARAPSAVDRGQRAAAEVGRPSIPTARSRTSGSARRCSA